MITRESVGRELTHDEMDQNFLESQNLKGTTTPAEDIGTDGDYYTLVENLGEMEAYEFTVIPEYVIADDVWRFADTFLTIPDIGSTTDANDLNYFQFDETNPEVLYLSFIDNDEMIDQFITINEIEIQFTTENLTGDYFTLTISNLYGSSMQRINSLQGIVVGIVEYYEIVPHKDFVKILGVWEEFNNAALIKDPETGLSMLQEEAIANAKSYVDVKFGEHNSLITDPTLHGSSEVKFGTNFDLVATGSTTAFANGVITGYEWTLPDGSTITDPTLNYNIPNDSNLVGNVLKFKVRARDSFNNYSKYIAHDVTVGNATAPIISSISWDIKNFVANQTSKIRINATDAEALPLTYTLTTTDQLVVIVNNNDSTFDITFPNYITDINILFTITADNGVTSTIGYETILVTEVPVANTDWKMTSIQGSSDDVLNDIRTHPNGFIYTNGHTLSGAFNGWAYFIMKLDSELNIIKQVTYSGMSHQVGTGLAFCANGDILASGYDQCDIDGHGIVRMDQDLNHIASVTESGTQNTSTGVCFVSEGSDGSIVSYARTGTYASRNVMFKRYNSSLEFVSAPLVRFVNVNSVQARGIFQVPSTDNVFVTVSHDTTSQGYYSVIVGLLNVSTNTHSSSFFGRGGNTHCYCLTSTQSPYNYDMLISGYHKQYASGYHAGWCNIINPDGGLGSGVLIRKGTNNKFTNIVMDSAQYDSDGNIWVVGYGLEVITNQNLGLIFKFSPTFELIIAKSFGGNLSETRARVTSIPGYMIIAYHSTSYTSGANDVVIIKIPNDISNGTFTGSTINLILDDLITDDLIYSINSEIIYQGIPAGSTNTSSYRMYYVRPSTWLKESSYNQVLDTLG